VSAARRRVLPVVVCDVDGTLNDERVPEAARLATVGPARAALADLRERPIPVILASARSLAEVRAYADAVGAGPVCIGEDGAALAAGGRDRCIAPGPTGWLASIRGLLGGFRESMPGLAASCDPPRTWTGRADPPALAILRGSAGRVASAIVLGVPAGRRAELERGAARGGLRTFGDVLHLLPATADKGTALCHVDHHARALFGGNVDGVLPLAFGNGPNDLPLFRAAAGLGGLAVLVGGPGGPAAGLPDAPWLHRVDLPHGHAVAEGLRRLLPVLLEGVR
jgi:hypothetical protein